MSVLIELSCRITSKRLVLMEEWAQTTIQIRKWEYHSMEESMEWQPIKFQAINR